MPLALEIHEPPMPAALTWCLIHGFMGDRRDWRGLVDVLSERDRVVGVDLPAHGTSVDIPLGDDPFAQVAAHLAETLAALPSEAPRVLVGYSLGGRLSLETLARHPGLVDALVLESAAAGGIADPLEAADRRALDARRAAAIRTDFDAFVERWYAAPLFASMDAHPAARVEAIARRTSQSPDAIASAIEAWSPGAQPPRRDTLAELAGRLPVLWIGGALDAKYSALGARLALEIPALTVRVVQGAGHNVHLERPDRFAEALLELRGRLRG